MAQQQQQQQSGSSGGSGGVGQFGDTTYTKVFVGGLAWETQKETMRRYFQQFGEILEAVVITDKNTGRSKGYGFVTFRDPESAMRACVDPSPIIDGRRANCNLASLGATRSRPSTPHSHSHSHSHGGRFRVVGSHAYYGGASAGFQAQPAQYAAAFHQGFPYQTYGFSTYSSENTYPSNYYAPYGGAHYPQIYASPGMISNPALYPYYQYAQTLQGSAGYPHAQNFGLHYPHIMHYPPPPSTASISTLPQQYAGLVSFPNALPSTGMTLALPAPSIYPMHPQHTPGGASDHSTA